jgi:hypothetical protein
VSTIRLIPTLALAAAALLLGAAPAAAQEDEAAVTWGVNPSSQDGPDGRAAFDYELDPGDTLIDFVGVSNFGTEPITVDVYASDAYTTATGAFDLLPSDTDPIDVGAWIGFNERTLTIDPETRLDIPFAISVPANATPGDHVGGIVAAIAERAVDDAGNEFVVERRVGARVHLRVTGDLAPVLEPAIDGETFHYDWKPWRPGSLSFDYTVGNTGNVRLAGTLVARVHGPWGLLPVEILIAELPQILPGDSLAGHAELDGVWPLALLTVDLVVHPEPVADADADLRPMPRMDTERLWAPPWPQAAVLAALWFAVWLWLKIRRRRRRRAAALAEPYDTDEPEPEPAEPESAETAPAASETASAAIDPDTEQETADR